MVGVYQTDISFRAQVSWGIHYSSIYLGVSSIAKLNQSWCQNNSNAILVAEPCPSCLRNVPDDFN